MEFTGGVILLGGLLFLVSILSSALSPRVGIPVLLIFLAVGMLAGEDGIGGIQFDDVRSAHLIGSIALAVILFDGGLRTQTESFRVALRPALGLATLGVVITAGVTGAFAVWTLGVTWREGLLIGAIVGSTDAAAVFSMLHSRGMALKDRVAATLEIESGLNDPMAVFLTVLLVEVVASGHQVLEWHTVVLFLWQMAAGGAVGVFAGRALGFGVTRLTLNPGMYPLLALFGGLFTFGLASVVGGSGFLAVYLAGLVLAQRVSRGLYNIQRFFDGAAWLSQISMFLILGLLVTPSEMLPYAEQALAVALALILVGRPAAVLVCLLPFRFSWREQAFISWVGLRGAVPIILATFPWIAGLEQWHFFFNLAFFVVLVSLVIQGWTVAPVARLLHLEVPSRSGRLQRVELGVPGQEVYELVGYRLESDSTVINAPAMQVHWPADVNLLFGIRGGRVLRPSDLQSLQSGDHAYFLAAPADLAALDRMMVGEREPERLGEREFFGAFVIRPDADLGELGQIYGFQVDRDNDVRTISDYLLRRFPQPVVGDRVRLGLVEFVVRQTEGDRICQVGLKLLSPADPNSR